MSADRGFELADAYVAAQALVLASTRALGMAVFVPVFARQHLGRVAGNAVCIAVSLPQAVLIWPLLRPQIGVPWATVLLALKEVFLGVSLGALMALPYWAVRNAMTLVDNQRGGNAAQMMNPALQPETSVLGELAERAFVIWLIQAGAFVVTFDVLYDSFALWPVVAPWPTLSNDAPFRLDAHFEQSLADALRYASPAWLLLLFIEVGLACTSTVVEGVQVYPGAQPLKSVLAVLLVAVYMGSVLELAGEPLIDPAQSGRYLRELVVRPK